MQEREIFEKVKEIVIEKLFPAHSDTIDMETDIAQGLGADSLDMLEIVLEIEERFGVTIPADMIDGVRTMKDMVVLLVVAEEKVLKSD